MKALVSYPICSGSLDNCSLEVAASFNFTLLMMILSRSYIQHPICELTPVIWLQSTFGAQKENSAGKAGEEADASTIRQPHQRKTQRYNRVRKRQSHSQSTGPEQAIARAGGAAQCQEEVDVLCVHRDCRGDCGHATVHLFKSAAVIFRVAVLIATQTDGLTTADQEWMNCLQLINFY